MKIFINVDIEGGVGVSHSEEVNNGMQSLSNDGWFKQIIRLLPHDWLSQ